MNNNLKYRVGNIVQLRNSNFPKNFYIARIINSKDYDNNVHGVYLEDFWNPNNERDYTINIIPRDYSNNTPYRMSQLEGVEITGDWLLDNDFATLEIYDNEVHGEIYAFIKDCFGKNNEPDYYHTLIYTDRYRDDDGTSYEVTILYNKDSNDTHIVSYKNTQVLDMQGLYYNNNYKVHKVFTGKIYEIHELQNILMDMDIKILDSFRK